VFAAPTNSKSSRSTANSAVTQTNKAMQMSFRTKEK